MLPRYLDSGKLHIIHDDKCLQSLFVNVPTDALFMIGNDTHGCEQGRASVLVDCMQVHEQNSQGVFERKPIFLDVKIA